MKRSMIVFLGLVLATMASLNADHHRGGRVAWLTNYDEAVRISKATSKPMLLLFTGSDWCSWCIKLEKEALNTPEFAEMAADKFVFVRLDFPVNKALSPELTTQNKRLQKDYDIEGFPTVVILDSQQKQIGTTGYRPGGGKQYAQYLFKMVDDSAVYKQKMSALDKEQMSGSDLKQLYEKATALGEEGDAHRIISAGMQGEQQQFFLIEKYRRLASEGSLQTAEAVALKQQLLAGDPQNAAHVHYQIAMIDFEVFCREMHDGTATPEQAVSPLLSYIKEFGESDKNNIWRMEMLVSQTFYDKDRLPEALEYAEFSYNAAPATVQPDIANAIKNMRSYALSQ